MSEFETPGNSEQEPFNPSELRGVTKGLSNEQIAWSARRGMIISSYTPSPVAGDYFIEFTIQPNSLIDRFNELVRSYVAANVIPQQLRYQLASKFRDDVVRLNDDEFLSNWYEFISGEDLPLDLSYDVPECDRLPLFYEDDED